jgi:hypothetical protein
MTRTLRRDRQAVRLLSIFLLLLQGSRLTVNELAARFKTRRETIYRDLRTLGDVGIPIEGDESGRLSRPRLAADYRLRFAPVPLTRHEIAALVWAVKESRTLQPFRAALTTALPKLQTFASPSDGRLAVAFDGAVADGTAASRTTKRPGRRCFACWKPSSITAVASLRMRHPGKPGRGGFRTIRTDCSSSTGGFTASERFLRTRTS